MLKCYIIKNDNKIELKDIEVNRHNGKVIGIDVEGNKLIVPIEDVFIEEDIDDYSRS